MKKILEFLRENFNIIHLLFSIVIITGLTLNYNSNINHTYKLVTGKDITFRLQNNELLKLSHDSWKNENELRNKINSAQQQKEKLEQNIVGITKRLNDLENLNAKYWAIIEKNPNISEEIKQLIAEQQAQIKQLNEEALAKNSEGLNQKNEPAANANPNGNSQKLPAATHSCIEDARKASYDLWKGGELMGDQIKFGNHECGKTLYCKAGNDQYKIPRQCQWQ